MNREGLAIRRQANANVHLNLVERTASSTAKLDALMEGYVLPIIGANAHKV